MKTENRKLNISHIIVMCIVISLLLFGVPLLIDWLIIGNEFPSNIENSDWVSFLGGYVGAILGGCISLTGIYWTIRFTREENRADREVHIRPAFDIYAHHLSEVKENWLGYVLALISDGDIKDPERMGCVFLRIKNVGVGPALNIDFRPSIVGVECKYLIDFHNNNEKVTTNALMPGEQAGLTIDVLNCKRAPMKQEYQLMDRDHDVKVLKEILPSNFRLDLEFLYEDLLCNWFVQKMSFSVSYMLEVNETERTKISCDINMVEIGDPQIYPTKPEKYD